MAGRLRRWLVGLVVIACAAGLLAAVGPASTGSGPWQERFITDAQGRALILYGLNTSAGAMTSADGMPWITQSDVGKENRELGTDFVRYLICWQQIEPEPGRFDQAYLARVAQRVSWYQQQGYHVLLDMQQNMYGSQFGGSGAPPWATDSGGLPVKAQQPWDLTYTQPGVVHAFDEFWGTRTDHPEYQQQYIAAWTKVAAYFAKNDAVIGYDLMGQPWGGSLQGPAFESGPLARFYQRAITAIRTVDSSHWLFVEPEAATTDWGLPGALPKLDDPRTGPARIGYAPQLYPEPLDSEGSYTGSNSFVTDRELASWEIQVERTAQRMDAPVLLGSWSANAPDPYAHLYIDKVQQLVDQMMIGEAYWSSDPGSGVVWDAKGAPTELTPVLGTAYPRAIAGQPVAFGYDKSTLDLNVQWTDLPGVTGTTDLYLPPTDFPNGGKITLNSSCTTKWNPTTHVLSVTVPKLPHGVHDLDVVPA
ncbi:glycoside hydrolase family 5 protein [Streptacidiphilus sp. PB12-B1b]|uniref:cellulase family glycosylhydrolase n=1 Tax=Streptacidiphilus sp. PB12-B1b TaxID=2705012 RepID=UPI0015F8B1E7|nr:cellulase family glycosylhydrolase [Streptacidiphilus sp. PB12-B1b]QMU75132.1 glycoside hydrolase family 5 protein [Streptacidiphilus sp. PB12-B1b]